MSSAPNTHELQWCRYPNGSLLCMCVCMCICMYVCMCMYICMNEMELKSVLDWGYIYVHITSLLLILNAHSLTHSLLCSVFAVFAVLMFRSTIKLNCFRMRGHALMHLRRIVLCNIVCIIWVYEYMSIIVYEYMSIWVCIFVLSHPHSIIVLFVTFFPYNTHILTHIYSYTHILIYSYTHTLIYSYTHILMYSYAHTLIYSYTHILICSYTHILIHNKRNIVTNYTPSEGRSLMYSWYKWHKCDLIQSNLP